MDTTRPSLLSRVRDSSDSDSWREFDRQYRDLVLRYCTRRGLQLADAEDVRQSVMVSLSRSLRNFRYDPSVGRFRDYLGRTVRNAVYAHLRSKGRIEEAPLEEAQQAEAPPEMDEAWEQEWVQHHYRVAMAKLRRSFEPQSMLVFELLLQGRTVAQVSEEHSITAEAIYKIKQRVKERLQAEIALQLQESEFLEREAGSNGPSAQG